MITKRIGPGWAACLAALFLFVHLSGCGAEMEASEAIERNGVMYRKGSQKPFSGVVTGRGRYEGYRNFSFEFKKSYKKGLLDGRSYFYYPDGQLESIEPYSDGQLNGVVTQYHPNGQIKARLHFVDGFRGGAKGEMFWNADGSRNDG